MATVEFFKQQAKCFLKDYNSRVYDESEGVYKYNPRYFNDIDELIVSYDIPEDGSFTLMNAQHIIAKLAGFYKWNELIKASESRLELGKLLIINRESYSKKSMCFAGIVEDWEMYESKNLKRLNLDDESKLAIFKEVFLSEEKEFKEPKGRKLKLDFSNDLNAQDMLCKIMKKKDLTPEKAILSSITQKNCIKILSSGWASIALSLWGHENWGANDFVLEKLDNSIIEVKLSGDKVYLINTIREIEGVTYKEAILYFMLFTLESLGYHI